MFEQQQIFQCEIDILDAGNSIDGFPVVLNIMSQSITWSPVFWDSETDVSLSGKKRSNIRGYDVNIKLDYDRMLEPDKLKTILDGLIQAKSDSVEVRFAPDANSPDEYFSVVPTENISRLVDYEDTIKKGESPTLAFESDTIVGQTDTPSSSPSVGDADTFDGLESTQFLRSDVDDSFNGDHIDFNSTVGISDNLTMYSNRITSVGTPQNNADVATKGYVDNAIDGLDWQESVLDEINDPSGLSPNTGDRYLVGENGVGDFAGQDENIAEWDGTQWTFEIPDEGFTLEIESNGYIWIFNGTTWVRFGSAVSHNQLQDLDASDHMGQTLDNGVAVYNAGTDKLDSKNLANLIGGTTNQISVGDDGDGTVTLSAPQDLHTQADFGVNRLDFDDRLSTRDYTSGALGEGAIVDNTTPRGSHIEADNIRVRSTLRTHVFKKDIIRASNSMLYVTDASEIVSPVTTPSTTSTSFTITVKQGVFTSGDTVEYKDINEDDGSIYEVVADITDNGTSTTVNGQNVVEYTASLTSGTDVSLKAGDTIVRTSGATILLDASSANAPFMDILQNGDVKQRSGNLNGITDTVNGEDVQGYGLYSDNAFLKGGIVATFGALGGWDINSTTISGGNIVIDSNGEIRNTTLVNSVPAWKLANDGSGHLAGGNIDWQADGSVDITAGTFDLNAGSGDLVVSSTSGISLNSGTINLDKDGSGQVAGGNISWSTDGSGQLASGNISWQSDGSLDISAGTFDLNAGSGDLVVSSTSGISLNNGTVSFNLNGSGQLASGNISWDDAGNAEFEGTLTTDDGNIGGWVINTNNLVSPDTTTAELHLQEAGNTRVTIGSNASLPATVPTSYTHSPSSATASASGGSADTDHTGHFDDNGGGYNPNKQIELEIDINDNSIEGTFRWSYQVQGYDGTNWVNVGSGTSGTGDYNTTRYISLVGYDDGRISFSVTSTKPSDDLSGSLSVDVAQYQAETVINKYGVFSRLSPNTVKAIGDSEGSDLAVPISTVFGRTGDVEAQSGDYDFSQISGAGSYGVSNFSNDAGYVTDAVPASGGTFTGEIDVTDGSDNTYITYFGIESNRNTAYYRPRNEDTSQNLQIGYSAGNQSWGTINLDADTVNVSNDLDISGQRVAVASSGLIYLGDIDGGDGSRELQIRTGGTDAIRVDGSQQVGIKTTSPVATLDVNGSLSVGDGTDGSNLRLVTGGDQWELYPRGNTDAFGIYNRTKGFWHTYLHEDGEFEVADGGILASGTVTWNSDRRLKSEIDPIANPVEKLMATKGRQYFRDDKDGKFEHGFIAQELYKVFPDAVRTPDDGMWSVSDVAVTATLVEGFKNHEQRIRELEQENEELKAKLDEVA